MRSHSAILLSALILMVLGLTGASYDGQATINAQPTESTSVFHNAVQKKYYYNATQKKDVTAAWGAEVSITWTDPDLKWGTFSAHRVALVQQSPWRYAEVGWIKRTTGLFIFVTWDDGSGPQSRQFSNLSPATHVYSSQYDPNTAKHWFYIDGSSFHSQLVNFAAGDRVVAGGEVYDGVESMGRTLLFDLYYSVNEGGSFFYVPWNGYERYLEDYPYCNMSNGLNSFYDTECPYRLFVPLVLKDL